MENNKSYNERPCKIIVNSGIARNLLKAGCVIVDIKKAKESADKTVFVFKNDEHFRAEFERINKEIAAAKAANATEQ